MIGRLIVEHRRRLALTQEELARKTGLSVRGLRDLESGRVHEPRKGSIRLLADALELTGPERERFYREAYETNRPPGDGAPSGASRIAVVPAQLPADTAGFAGRGNELDLLDTLLTPDGAATEPTDATVFVVSGTAGVGKSALAVRWAHRVRERFPDGQLFINLRGFAPGTPIAPVEALHGFLEALHVPPQRIPAGHETRAALYRSLLAGRRMLVVLDNARDSEQVRPLLPGAAGCRAVITSRSRLSSLAVLNGARLLTLDLLTTDEARKLLAGRLGATRVAAEPAAVDAVIAQCGRLPRALAIVAALATADPRRPLTVLASSMCDRCWRN
jgi:transcriptional regulator with XRE-family HTH domain